MLIKLAIGLVIGSVAVGTLAQTSTDIQAGTGNSAYAQDGRSVIVRNPYGLCWRTGYWTESNAVTGCDGQLVPPVAKITAPAIPALPPAAPASTQSTTATPVPKQCDFVVTLANDQTFAFNKAVLSNAAKRRIDEEVASKLAACTKVEKVMITGHTDSIGTQQYNKKLSEKRAGTVAAYLRNKNTALNIQTVGAGEAQPIKDCGERLNRKQLVECLAPNRRVVIQVKGASS